MRLPVTVHVKGDDTVLICRTRNISAEGCLLDTDQPLRTGTSLGLAVMDDLRGEVMELVGTVVRNVSTGSPGTTRGLGIYIQKPSDHWRALVARRFARRKATQPEFRPSRQRVLVTGDPERQRGALALYVQSGWDVRFSADPEGAEEALEGPRLDAVVCEYDLDDNSWTRVMDSARRLQPAARRILRTSLRGAPEGASQSPPEPVDRIVDRDAGFDALIDAVTADFGRFPSKTHEQTTMKQPSNDPVATTAKPEIHPITGVKPLSASEARQLLDGILNHALELGDGAVIVFDLDSTLLDNRPRQARIMREYGQKFGLEALSGSIESHWKNGWDPGEAMANAGLEADVIAAHADGFKEFWRARFFTSEYCAIDRPLRGAAGYVRRVADTGARVCYVTGRHEEMRAGTLESFPPAGFPMPDGDVVQLLMKPTLDEDDDDYKARTYQQLRGIGQVIAAFDNEPTHINGYHRAFADATCVHLATDCSPRAVPVAEGIASIRHFDVFG